MGGIKDVIEYSLDPQVEFNDVLYQKFPFDQLVPWSAVSERSSFCGRHRAVGAIYIRLDQFSDITPV